MSTVDLNENTTNETRRASSVSTPNHYQCTSDLPGAPLGTAAIADMVVNSGGLRLDNGVIDVGLNSLADIAVNLVAAAVGGLAVWTAGRLRLQVKLFRARKFWRFVAGQSPLMVLGAQDQSALVGWERSGLVGIGDVDAVLVVQEQLLRLGISGHVMLADAVPHERRRESLVLFGGPDANALTADVWMQIESDLTFDFPGWREHIIELADKTSGDTYIPSPGSHGTVISDYGVIIRTANPHAPDESMVLILAGCWGYGTAAAAEVLHSKALLRHRICVSGRPFEALVRTNVLGSRHHAPRLVDVRPLPGRAKR